YTLSRTGVATCLAAKTGAEVWRERLEGQPCASLITLRGKVLFLSEDGTAFVVEPGPAFKLLHKNKLGDWDEVRDSPAGVDGQLPLRQHSHLSCVEDGEKNRHHASGNSGPGAPLPKSKDRHVLTATLASEHAMASIPRPDSRAGGGGRVGRSGFPV